MPLARETGLFLDHFCVASTMAFLTVSLGTLFGCIIFPNANCECRGGIVIVCLRTMVYFPDCKSCKGIATPDTLRVPRSRDRERLTFF